MIWTQRILTLRPRPRGFHVVTSEILEKMPEVRDVEAGFLHLFIQHTSASLTINENASPDVRSDLEAQLNELAPEGRGRYSHSDEGPDDMPAHIKASLLGSGLLIPVGKGELLLGTWQGIYLGEHRDRGGARRVVATAFGEKAAS